jgi:eukaryotic-like serine/threonine-protein kinase
VETATPRNVEADEEAMTVSYDVSYRMKDGTRREDSSTLDLVPDGDSYLIDGEG